jgi:hypothetical protein
VCLKNTNTLLGFENEVIMRKLKISTAKKKNRLHCYRCQKNLQEEGKSLTRSVKF